MLEIPNRVFTIDFIRHAKSKENEKGDTFGTSDAELSPEGIAQAQALGAYLKRTGYGADEYHCSPFPRVRHTATLALQGMGLDPSLLVFDKRLVEIDRGDWAGKKRTDVLTPELMRRAIWEDMDFATPGGESMHQVAGRMYKWLLDICFDRPDWGGSRRFAVFSHGFAIKCLLHRILGNKPELTWRLSISNTSVTTLMHDPLGGWFIKRINATPHLDKRL